MILYIYNRVSNNNNRSDLDGRIFYYTFYNRSFNSKEQGLYYSLYRTSLCSDDQKFTRQSTLKLYEAIDISSQNFFDNIGFIALLPPKICNSITSEDLSSHYIIFLFRNHFWADFSVCFG